MFKLSIIPAVLLLAATAFSSSYSKEPVLADEIFIPKGFDSNDKTEVVLTGWLPNTCYLRPEARIFKAGNHLKLRVTAEKYTGPHSVCIEMLVPYQISVPLGRLNAGSYQVAVLQNSNRKVQDSFIVETANSDAIDNHLYASIKSVKELPGTRTVLLQGENPSDCVSLDHVKVISNDKNTFSILPVMKKTKDFCAQVITPFAYPVKIPNNLEADKLMLHIRSMDGSAVNHLFRNRQ